MKGLKTIRVDNFRAYKKEVVNFDREGNILSGHTKGFVKSIIEYIIGGDFTRDKSHFTKCYVHHPVKKFDKYQEGRVKNLYMLIEFFTKDGAESFIEIYSFDNKDKLEGKLDKVIFKLNQSTAYQFEGELINSLNPELVTAIATELLANVDL